MTDPLDALRSPVQPVDPDPAFAERLRAQLRQAVLNPLGDDTMTTTETELTYPATLAPYIVVSDARAALDWYVDVFGATPRGEPIVNADGTIGHAEVGIGTAVLMFAEASDLWPDVPVAPPSGPHHSHTLHLQIEDVDDTTHRAAAAGATVERPPTDQPYGRGSVIVDPFGHRWMLLRPPAPPTSTQDGDVTYVTMAVADDEAAKAFYSAVFGWEWRPGTVPHGWTPAGKEDRFGLWGGGPGQHPEVQLCYQVTDLAAAVERVRAHGGQAGAIERKPYGLMADCVDNQGARFQLLQQSG
ncbi:MAG TPA: VOC family protein [Actinophytocola sp.]|uniref:VOC family protein n=1 Tax=Actinophytocola sp. TaxID=1872138 RepID=UPI002E0758A4|nr:VOC family protein [Actinophytocola sp.]